MGILSWILMGAIAGFLAYRILGMEGQGCLVNVVLGVVGAFVGGLVFNFFGGSGVTGFNFYSMIVATIGAVVIIAIARMLGGGSRR